MNEQIIHQQDFNTISADCFYIESGCVVRINVKLFSKYKDKYGNKRFSSYHKAFGYVDETRDQVCATMRLSYSYYYTIDNKNDKTSAMVTMMDIPKFIMGFNRAASWFNIPDLFIKGNGDNMIVNEKKKIDSFNSVLLVNHKSMSIYPKAIEVIDGLEKHTVPGARFEIEDVLSVDLTPEKVYEMQYFFSTTSMMLLAQSVLNYLGRPELNTNLYQFAQTTEQSAIIANSNPSNVFGRVPDIVRRAQQAPQSNGNNEFFKNGNEKHDGKVPFRCLPI